MKVLLVACVLALASLASAHDAVNVDDYNFLALFDDKKQWKTAVECFLDHQPCGELQGLKEAVVKRLKNKCSGCDEKQLKKYNNDLKVLQEKYPEDFKAIMKKVAEH